MPNYSTTNATQHANLTTPTDNLLNNTLVNPDTDTPSKYIQKQIIRFLHHRFELHLILSSSSLLNTPLLLKENKPTTYSTTLEIK